MIQFTLTLKMAATQVVEMSVTVNNNSLIQDYVHLDDHTQPTYDSWVETFHSIYFVHKVMKSYFVKYSVA